MSTISYLTLRVRSFPKDAEGRIKKTNISAYGPLPQLDGLYKLIAYAGPSRRVSSFNALAYSLINSCISLDCRVEWQADTKSLYRE